jgi:hypothetical protein
VCWVNGGTHIAVGTSCGRIQVWDAVKSVKVRELHPHTGRVGALSWNQQYCLIASGLSPFLSSLSHTQGAKTRTSSSKTLASKAPSHQADTSPPLLPLSPAMSSHPIPHLNGPRIHSTQPLQTSDSITRSSPRALCPPIRRPSPPPPPPPTTPLPSESYLLSSTKRMPLVPVPNLDGNEAEKRRTSSSRGSLSLHPQSALSGGDRL